MLLISLTMRGKSLFIAFVVSLGGFLFGFDAGIISDRFEAGARRAASHAVGFTKSSAATGISYDVALVAVILIGVPIAWWLETPPALLVFALILFVLVEFCHMYHIFLLILFDCP